jgi:type II secretory ATPase GspE/PulE/Tfp pilus assembly ATPase PilB-like protein
MRVPAPVQPPLINRLKVMANLDIAKRPVQQGTLKVRLGGQVFTFAIEVTRRGNDEEASLRLPPDAAKPNSSAAEAAT